MEREIAPALPRFTLENIQRCPTDRPVIFLMRHSARGNLPKDETGDAVPLTEEGMLLGSKFGEILRKISGVQVVTLHSSPVLRCRQTADALMDGIKYKLAVDIAPNLTLPGPFISNMKLALTTWHTLGGEEVLRRMSAEIPGELPGMPPLDSAVRKFVQWLFFSSGNQAGIHVFVTHDSIVLPVAAQIPGVRLGMDDWPAFLDGVLLWKENVVETPSSISEEQNLLLKKRNFNDLNDDEERSAESEPGENKSHNCIRCLYRKYSGKIQL